MASFFAFLLWNAHYWSPQFCHWLLLVRANVRKHIKANNVKTPPHVMQKSLWFRALLKVAFSFNFNSKIGTIKANTRHICCFISAKISVTFRLRWASICWLFLGEYVSSLRHSLNQVEAWYFRLDICVFICWQLLDMWISLRLQGEGPGTVLSLIEMPHEMVYSLWVSQEPELYCIIWGSTSHLPLS